MSPRILILCVVAGLCLPRAQAQSKISVLAGNEFGKAYSEFVQGAQSELLIVTPSIIGKAAYDPIAKLRETHDADTTKIVVFVEGPEAVQTQTPDADTAVGAETVALPINAATHKRDFHITSTWLLRDKTDLLIRPGRIDFEHPTKGPAIGVEILNYNDAGRWRKTFIWLLDVGESFGDRKKITEKDLFTRKTLEDKLANPQGETP